MRRTVLSLALLVAIAAALTGCMRDQQTVDVGELAQAAYNAAASLPPSPQRTAIMATQVQIAETVGHPIDPAQGK